MLIRSGCLRTWRRSVESARRTRNPPTPMRNQFCQPGVGSHPSPRCGGPLCADDIEMPGDDAAAQWGAVRECL